jgi:hypothetical protein
VFLTSLRLLLLSLPFSLPPSQYPGGSCRLHMLRKLLGDEVFWKAVRTYVDR